MEDGGTLSLRDIHRSEGENAADAVLEKVLPVVFTPGAGPYPARLRDIRAHFASLLTFAARHDVGLLVEPIRHAAAVAEDLISSQGHVSPLHGDIHHENLVSHNGTSWRLIDPHGLIGDPHYDVANLFGNPLNAPEVVLSPQRVAHLSVLLSRVLGLERRRILRFALAHCGLSVAWHLESQTIEPATPLPERVHLLRIIRSLLANDQSNKSP